MCAAWMLRERSFDSITILEQSSVPGGMLRTLSTPDGLTYEYGPRVVSVFRGTPDVIPFLRRFVELEERDIYQGTQLRPDFPVIPFPVDRESIAALPVGAQVAREIDEITRAAMPPGEASLREYLETSVGPTLTELAFQGFNRKFWGRRLEEMPAEWGKLRRLERIAERGRFRLPSEAPHYYPRGGFNALFDRMLEGFDVRYGVQMIALERAGQRVSVVTETGSLSADVVISTAPIDAVFGYAFGPLEWRGYRIDVGTADRAALGVAPDGVPFAWLYTPWHETPVCRITDFGVIHDGTERGPRAVVREVADDGVRMYPVWWEAERLERYLEAAAGMPALIPLGRLGLYKYVTMDSTLSMVQRLAELFDGYLTGDLSRRLELLHELRGDWRD